MEKEFLEQFGLSEEAIGRIMAEADKSVSNATSWGDSERKKLEGEKASLEVELEEANKTISKLQGSNAENKSLQNAIDSYKQKIDEIKEQANRDRVDLLIDLALERAGAINPMTVKPLLDTGRITLGEDGQVSGLNEQITDIMGDESNSFLFRQPEPAQAEAPPAPEVKRGGYEPLAADSQARDQKESAAPSYGAMAAEYIRSQKESISKSVADFWGGNN